MASLFSFGYKKNFVISIAKSVTRHRPVTSANSNKLTSTIPRACRVIGILSKINIKEGSHKTANRRNL